MSMNIDRFTGCLALTLVAVTCLGQQTKNSVVLPSSEAKSVMRLCSRSGPSAIDGGWQPSPADIALLEVHLFEISALRPRCCSPASDKSPASFFRQYLGVVIGGRRLIYVNAFPADFARQDWRSKMVNVCDGGPFFWGVLFDPATATFSDFSTNGAA